VQELRDFVTSLAAPAPAFLVGHSLGGILSMMVAAQSRVGAWRGAAGLTHAGRLACQPPQTGQTFAHGRVALSPAAVSRKRRTSWPSQAQALAHFQHKRAFAKWDPRCYTTTWRSEPTTTSDLRASAVC
jgi:alpha-beta hydrolase superfamily lysophospholipase